MVWCSYCGKDQPTERDDINGFTCCTGCGRVLDDNVYSSDPTFMKTAGGQSQLAGNFVKEGQYSSYGRVGGDSSHDYGFKTDSHEKTLEKGRDEIQILADTLTVSGRDDAVNAGHRLYVIAVERNFTRGRRIKQVAAACLYIVCRKSEATLTKRLIEFENTESGSLTAEEFETKAKELEAEMQSTKLPLMNPMIKGIRGIAELLCEHKDIGAKHFAHGLCHTCYDEFVKLSGGIHGGSAPPAFQRAEQKRAEESSRKSQEKTCIFDDEDEERQYEIAAEQHLEVNDKNTKEKEKQLNLKKVEDRDTVTTEPRSVDESSDKANTGHSCKSMTSRDGCLEGPNGDSQNGAMGSCISETAIGCQAETDEWTQNQSQGSNKVGDFMELESLSDIDDDEVEKYLHNDEEVRLKTIIWTEMNKEYLEEQAAKEEALAAAQAAHAAALAAAAEGSPAAVELAAAAAAAVAKLKKDKQRKRAEESKNRVPAQSAAEATRQMLVKKKLSSKVNYDVLEKLFEDNKKDGTRVSNSVEDTHNNSTVESGKRPRTVV